MRCPKCNNENFIPPGPCYRCRFSGEAALLEEWIGLKFLLNEIAGWTAVPSFYRERLRHKYGLRRREVEIRLGLRRPPLDAKAAEKARQELTSLRSFTYLTLNKWLSAGWLTTASAEKLRQENEERIEALLEQLVDAPESKGSYSYPKGRHRQLLYQLQLLETLRDKNRLAGLTVYDEARKALTADLHKVEIELGLRRPPEAPKPQPAAAQPAAPARQTVKAKPAAPAATLPPPPSRRPLTWDRVWETLLSERTLRAILFLGATLLFAAAVSLVIWNWETFPPWLQVTFLASFTALFYGMGWYVRRRMRLVASGIALTGVASLLVPLDFYAFYLSGGFLELAWSDVWLLTSAVCLAAYLTTIYLIQAEFFGYLVGLAAASLLTAGLRFIGVESAWWPVALTGLSLGLALTAAALPRLEGKGLRRWRVLEAPFWHLSVLGATAVLALSTGWGLIGRLGSDSFIPSLALSWWLGGGVYLLGSARFKVRMVGIAAAVSFPIAAMLTQRQLYSAWEISAGWYALGWALLAPAYMVVGKQLAGKARAERDETRAELLRAYGRTALAGCGLLIGVSFGWALADGGAMGLVHLLLALTMVPAARLWRRPNYLTVAGFFLVTSTAGLVSSAGGTIGHLGFGWALLAVGHVAAAIRLSASRPHGKAKEENGGRPYGVPLFRAGWAIGALALLPPLLTQERPILTYGLGNWIALNGWLALLVHEERLLLSHFWPRAGRWQLRLGALTFQWTAALLLPFWLWLAWTNGRPGGTRMGLAFLGLGWAALLLAGRLRRLNWSYGRPWFVAAQVSVLAAVLVSPFRFDQPAAAVLFLLASAFYTLAAHFSHNRLWLVAAGFTFPVGMIVGLDWLNLPLDPLMFAASLIVLAYTAGPLVLHRYYGLSRLYQRPLKDVAYVIGSMLFFFSWVRVFTAERSDALLMWHAALEAVLALTVAVYGWSENEEGFGHIAAWLGVLSGGLVGMAFSRGSGSSAAEAALLAILYIAAERLLRRAALKKGWQWRPQAGELWVLFRRPILTAGWGVSFIAIFLALVRNMIFLGGGRTRESWAIIALLLITGLYLVSSWLYRRYPRMSGRRVWWAAALIFFPWTLLTHMGWYLWPSPEPASRYAVSWAILALGMLAIGTLMTAPAIDRRWARPPKVVAHLLMPFALVWGIGNSATSSVSVGLGIIFYLLAVFSDRLSQLRLEQLMKLPHTSRPRSRFLYPATLLVPIWGVHLLDYFAPGSTAAAFGTLLLAFSLPFLLFGRWVARRERSFARPLYLVGLGTAVTGTLLTAENQPILIGALLFDAFLGVLSSRLFKQPLWLYVTVLMLPAALLLSLDEWGVPPNRFGWGLLGLSQGYLLVAWGLARWQRAAKERSIQRLTDQALPFLVGLFWLLGLGLLFTSQDRIGAQFGYLMAAFVLIQAAAWLKEPILTAGAAALFTIPYWITLSRMSIGFFNLGPALWPLILLYLLAGYGLDSFAGYKKAASEGEGESGEDGGATAPAIAPFPWELPDAWPLEAVRRLRRWWALPFYAIAYGGAALSVLLSVFYADRLTITLLLSAAVCGWALVYTRLRGWLVGVIAALQLAILAGFAWAEWGNGASEVALQFMPVTFVTAFLGIYIERRWRQGAFSKGKEPRQGKNWARPFFLVLAVDVLVGQMIGLNDSFSAFAGAESVWITLGHFAILAVLAVWWRSGLAAALTVLLGFAALAQFLIFREAAAVSWPPALALLAVGYGLTAYLLRFFRKREIGWVLRPAFALWERPLLAGGWFAAGLSLLAMSASGLNVVRLALRSVFHLPLLTPDEVVRVQMVAGVLSLVGLLFLAAAVVDRLPRQGYAAVGMLLAAWSLELALVWGGREVQYYAVPAGAYLLVVGYLEWHNGSRALARWIDNLALVLLLGTSFWQSLGPMGWSYALLMGFEGLMITWWGSTRRLRRFLYAGVVGVTVDVIGQLIQPLLTATNRWIVFGIVGIFLVSLAILVERRLENVLALTKDVRRRLENWE